MVLITLNNGLKIWGLIMVYSDSNEYWFDKGYNAALMGQGIHFDLNALDNDILGVDTIMIDAYDMFYWGYLLAKEVDGADIL